MPIRYLDKLFYPRSIAVIGPGQHAGDPGHLVMVNLLRGGFEGPILPVSSRHRAVCGVLTYPSVAALPITPDLAVISGDPPAVLAALGELGARGTRAAIVLIIDTARIRDQERFAFQAAVAAAARPFGMRVLGPNGMGLIVPHIGLNASIAHVPASTGGIAFVSQSSAMCAGVLDWAQEHDVGFAHFVSLGDTADIDFADVLDFLGGDAMTRAVLLYVETIGRGRAFMSAGRGASRNKPVLVLKAGRFPQGQDIVALRTQAAVGADDVYDAAFRRAGMLRVFSFGELFAAVETLARARPLRGERLAIVANGFGLATMAADNLIEKKGHLADLTAAAADRLAEHLPQGTSRTNPVRLATDAAPSAYATAARDLLAAPEVDAVMVLHVPSAMASSTEAADGVVRVAKDSGGNILTCWMGGPSVARARRRFVEAGVPTYDTPTQAIDAFSHMVRYRRNQVLLMETPSSTLLDFTPDVRSARRAIDGARLRNGSQIVGAAAREVLEAYGLPTVSMYHVDTPEQALAVALDIGFPVSLAIAGADHTRPAADGATRIVDRPGDIEAVASSLLTAARFRRLGAAEQRLMVRKESVRPGMRESRVSVITDPVFGPVITFACGCGGGLDSGRGARAVALPPLNMALARDLVERTPAVDDLIGDDRHASVDLDTLCLALVRISQLIVDLPEIAALDIDPLLMDDQGVVAVDARIHLCSGVADRDGRLAIRPYPKELEEAFVLRSGRQVLLRPIRPEDEPQHYEFLSRITMEDLRYRFFGVVGHLPHAEMARLTQIDYDREMAFIATARGPDGGSRETLGVIRTIADPNNDAAEFAILVRSDLKGQGLGRKLMEKMIHYCRARGTRRIAGQVMRNNGRMLDLVTSVGFGTRPIPEDDIIEVAIDLRPDTPPLLEARSRA